MHADINMYQAAARTADERVYVHANTCMGVGMHACM